MRHLPVYRERERVLEALTLHQVVVVESPTGSGKTTQLPVILHEAGYTKQGVVGITQPRRIAALSVCHYIASNLDSPVPGLVGYKMRFVDETTKETRLKIMTDGTLLQEMRTDPLLQRYALMMIDEAHERSLNIDFILGLLRGILEVRPEFKIIVSSATINAAVFSEYFGQCPIVHIDTPVFPVETYYRPLAGEGKEAFEAMIRELERLISQVVSAPQHSGDILVFLPGEKAIKECLSALSTSPCHRDLLLVPLYGRLSREEQEKVFERTPPGKTKVVVATNIAETSITIDGITTVIDSGQGKLNYYHSETFTSSLIEAAVSQASCNQRRGRAGRTQPGVCYRLYSQENFSTRPPYSEEEIYRTDLAEVVLRMADLGIIDFHHFPFISPPERKGLEGGIFTLKLLGALDKQNRLTSVGEMMVALPLLPKQSRMIIASVLSYPDVIKETIIAASFLSTNSPFLLPQGEETEARAAHLRFKNRWGDFASYLRLFDQFTHAHDHDKFCKIHYLDERLMWEITHIVAQLEEIVSQSFQVPVLSGGKTEDFLCACGQGLIQFISILTRGYIYKTLTADRVIIHPGSVMFGETPRFLLAGEIVRTTQTYARSVSPLEEAWLDRISPGLLSRLTAASPGKKRGARSVGKAGSSLTIGGEMFPFIPRRNRSPLAFLDWKKLSRALQRSQKGEAALIASHYKHVKGVLRYRDQELAETGLDSLLKVAELLDPSSSYLDRFPTQSFDLDQTQQREQLATILPLLMKVSRRKGTRKATLGFLTLLSEKEHLYRLACSPYFTTALSENLATLESLSKKTPQKASLHPALNTTYRRLERYFY